jgi:hypothetical protein
MVTNWRKKMNELKEIVLGLDRIEVMVKHILENQKIATAPFYIDDSHVKFYEPPKKSHKEVLDEIHE